MKKNTLFLLTMIILAMASTVLFAQNYPSVFPPNYKVDTRIDNMGYWQKCAEAGLVPVQPFTKIPAPTYTGSKLLMRGVYLIDSPDILVTNEPSSSTQSENSLVINPNDKNMLLNSNNSTPQPSNGSVKGADALKTLDAAATWSGTVEGAGGSNSGDPAAVIDLNGRWYVGYINNAGGMSVSYSDNNGSTWTVKSVAGGSLDKNHLWADLSPVSPYKNYIYNGWMTAAGALAVSRSITSGSTWAPAITISAGTAAGSHNQGINFKCGPDGEVYAAWAVYDSWPSDEKAIGFNKSLDGGATWGTAFRALNNIKGIRNTGSVSQNMRTNSFPSMAVDLSNSPYRGTIYIVWTNIGVPGVNTGTGSSVYLIKSTDKGATWSTPLQVNTNSTAGKHHYMPWITCDQANGYVSVVFYDNRDCPANQAEAWMAYSTDGGQTFADLKVSDVAFTPSPIPNMANLYMGDYLAIAAYDGMTYPCWTDTRSGHCLTYVSPINIQVPVAAIESTGYSLNDTTFGNGNGLMDYGETELAGLTMKNTGNASADSVSVHLSCDNQYITVIDSIKDYGHFEIGEEKFIHDGFKFKVNDSIQNNDPVIFTVQAIDKQLKVTWSAFQITAHAPDVSIVSMTISDLPPGGNSNGRLDPGEEATLLITTKNNGIWDAENVVSTLSSMNSYVTVGTPVFNIGTLHAGETVIASFPVMVNSGAAIGSAAQLHNVATSKYRVTEKTFNAKIGLIVEDWETGNFSKFPWQFTNAAKPWTIDPVIKYEGNYSARSGVIGDNETSGLFIDYHASMDDSISFFRRISSQPVNDNLKFYIDNSLVGMWSGIIDTSFLRYAYPVMAGPHTFKWTYEKNNAIASGLDAGWADFIVFPPQYKTTVSAGADADVCAGSNFQLHGMADSYDSVRWTTSGTGGFSNPIVLNPVYMPSMQDIADGMVQLTLTAYGMNSVVDTNSMMLMIYTAPTAVAGGNGTVCAGQAYPLSGSSATAYTALHWSTYGDGGFDNPAALHPNYSPGSQDIIQGSVKLVFNAIGSDVCPLGTDSLVLTIHAVPQVDLGNDTAACANATVFLNATHPDAVSYLWLPSNKTTPTITVDSTGTGLNPLKVLVFVTDHNGCVGRDSVMVTFTASPTAFAGGNSTVCSGQVYPISGSTATAYITLHWDTRGDGSFDNQATLHPNYSPGPGDLTEGTVRLIFYATGSAGCPIGADSLELTILALPKFDIGHDTAACANTSVLLNATYADAASYLWLPSNKTTPTITVDSAGIGFNPIKVLAFVTDRFGCVGKDSVMVSFSPSPTAVAGGNGSVCQGVTYPITGSSAMAYTTLHWVTKGDGSFDNQAILHPTYTPGPQDNQQGLVKLTLFATGSAACPVSADSLLLTIHAYPQVDLGKDTAACANAAVTLNATHPDAASYLWLPSNKTTPTITVDSTGIGLNSEHIFLIITGNNGCVGKDSVIVSFKVCGGIEELDGVSVQVFPNPNNGIFTLEIKAKKHEKLDVTIMSPSGGTLYSRHDLEVSGITTEKIDVSQFAQGTYLLQVSNGSGKLLRKIVIQK